MAYILNIYYNTNLYGHTTLKYIIYLIANIFLTILIQHSQPCFKVCPLSLKL